MSEWSYTEQLLHTLDEFETPDGFRIKHLEAIPTSTPRAGRRFRLPARKSGALGCWRVSLGPFRPDEPKSRFNIWLMMVSTGWWLSEVPALRWTGGKEPFETPEEALTVAKDLLRAREAAQRLGAGA